MQLKSPNIDNCVSSIHKTNLDNEQRQANWLQQAIASPSKFFKKFQNFNADGASGNNHGVLMSSSVQPEDGPQSLVCPSVVSQDKLE